MRRILFAIAAAALSCSSASAQQSRVPPGAITTIHSPRPQYPPEALKQRLEGAGVFFLHVRPDGRVQSVEIRKSTGHPSLDRAAVEAFQRWQFSSGAKPVVTVPFKFSLHGGEW